MTQMEYEVLEGLTKFTFIIGLMYGWVYFTRDLLFDYVLNQKTGINMEIYIKYMWKCVQLVILVGVTSLITIDVMRYYLNPGQ